GTEQDFIPPEVEFMGNISKMQTWVKSRYKSALLCNNIRFLLLMELSDAGDLLAKSALKGEIIKSLSGGDQKTFQYLRREKFIEHLTNEEVYSSILDAKNYECLKNLVSNDLKKVQWDFGKGLSNNVNFRFKKRKIVHLNLEGWELKKFPTVISKEILSNLNKNNI
ncbi:MAG: hypothetical protein ACTSUT_02990, partial [Promethearchaeota archaeon]